MEEPDFSGYATKAGLRCADGRTILPNAFQKQHGVRVPLVWHHGHSSVENTLGHAILEARPDGMYAYGFFNKSQPGKHAKETVSHGDITMLSIFANELLERESQVIHGVIREVSLVLAGANPGAVIDQVVVQHDGLDPETLDDQAVITTGLAIELAHSEDLSNPGDPSDPEDPEDPEDASDPEDPADPEDPEDPEDPSDPEDPENPDNPALQHAAGNSDPTIQDIYESMPTQYKDVLHWMLGQALEGNNSATHGAISTEGSNTMGHNAFDGSAVAASPASPNALSHDAMMSIVEDTRKRKGSLREAFEAYAEEHLEHGIEAIGELFPDATNLDNTPQMIGRRTEWVQVFLGGAHKSPFSRIKNIWADITGEEARARGYIKGSLKKEEFFDVAKRITTPTTVYKKQKLDRDDVVDITGFDVIVWLKAEMRLMLDEEVARAGLLGDGRDPGSDDKINESCIRPILKDNELFVTTINVNISDANSSASEITDAVIRNRKHYRGTGLPVCFTTESTISSFLLLRDGMQRRLYRSLDEVAQELRVSQIVPVEVMEDYDGVVAIIVNPYDYNFGADSGGEVNFFDDFDIDYNQQKYLIETRCSGALTKLRSALVIKSVAAGVTVVNATKPSFNATSGELTIPTVTGVVYKHGVTTVNNAGSPYTVSVGTPWVIDAVPASDSYALETNLDDQWEFSAE